ncbi:MAG: hypothetical protein ABF876_05275 [Acetobacter aceti]
MSRAENTTDDNGISQEFQSDGWPQEGWGEPEQPSFTGLHWVAPRSCPDRLFVATWSDRGFWIGFGARPAEFGKTHIYHGRALTPREISAAIADAHRAGYLAGREASRRENTVRRGVS